MGAWCRSKRAIGGNMKKKEYKKYGRNSGLKYKNSKERLQQIKEKYKNGITYKMILGMI